MLYLPFPFRNCIRRRGSGGGVPRLFFVVRYVWPTYLGASTPCFHRSPSMVIAGDRDFFAVPYFARSLLLRCVMCRRDRWESELGRDAKQPTCGFHSTALFPRQIGRMLGFISFCLLSRLYGRGRGGGELKTARPRTHQVHWCILSVECFGDDVGREWDRDCGGEGMAVISCWSRSFLFVDFAPPCRPPGVWLSSLLLLSCGLFLLSCGAFCNTPE